MPKSGMVVNISGSRNLVGISVMIYEWQLSLYIDMTYCYSSFIFGITRQMLLDQGQRCNLPSQYTGPWSRSWLWNPDLAFIKDYYLCNFWAWRTDPCSRQLGSLIHCPQVDKMVNNWPSPPTFLDIFILILNSRFAFSVICTGLSIWKSV